MLAASSAIAQSIKFSVVKYPSLSGVEGAPSASARNTRARNSTRKTSIGKDVERKQPASRPNSLKAGDRLQSYAFSLPPHMRSRERTRVLRGLGPRAHAGLKMDAERLQGAGGSAANLGK